jgi:hypothetical protein
MFSGRVKARWISAALAGAFALGAGAAMAGVIVKSSGPSAGEYPVGKKVADDATITLKAGDSITVLTADGTRVMKGAGSFKVSDNPTATRGRFAMLTRKRAARRVRTGAVRGGPTGEAASPTNPNLWNVDVSQSGQMCLFDLNAVRLWRPQTEGIATYRVIDTASESSIDVTFDDGADTVGIDPARMTFETGKHYTIAGPEGTDVANVTFAVVQGSDDNAEALADELIEAGCMAQVNLMADRLGG